MLVSFRSNVVFIKTPKTAGTSSEAYFQEALWGYVPGHAQGWKVHKDGFCTPRGRRERPSIAQQFKIVVAGKLPWNSLGKIPRLHNHSRPDQIRDSLGGKFWGNAKKIVNVRNPFDLLVSSYFFNHPSPQNRPDFEEWLRGRVGRPFPFLSYLDDSWSVIRYESLQEDLRRAVISMGLPVPDQLPRHKSGIRPAESKDYRDLYTPGTRRIVEELYGDWLRVLGYSF
jgi:hypothetical protein